MRQGRLIATGAMLVFCLFAIWQSLLLSLTDRLGPGPAVADLAVVVQELIAAGTVHHGSDTSGNAPPPSNPAMPRPSKSPQRRASNN